MKILHVATLVTPDGAYGGPIRVAVNQIRSLRALGHQAILVAAAQGYDELPTMFDGVPVMLFRARRAIPGAGFSGLVSPAMLRWIAVNGRRADVAHVHLARDLVVLPAARVLSRCGVPYVTQTHGMVMPSGHPLARPLDALMTRRALRAASANLYLTDVERLGLGEVVGPLAGLAYLPNGVPVFESRDAPAKSPDGSPREVLFLARLAPRKRPEMFVRAALRLIDEFPDVGFTLVGPDEGSLPSVTALIETSTNSQARRRIRWEGAVEPEAAAARIAAAELYVLPSVDEPFPMSVLEAMSSGTPVIVTESCGLAADVRAHRAGAVIDHTLGALVDSLRGFLSRPESVRECGDNASRLARDRYGMAAVAGELVRHYAHAVARRCPCVAVG